MTPAATTRIRPRGAARPARRPSGRSVRVRTVLIGAAVVAAVLGLIGIAWLSPLLSVRTVEVVGATAIPQEDVLARLELAEGTPLLQVDTAAAAQRVAALPRAASVRVQRVYPSTVRVTVTEREAVVFVDAPDGTHSLDADGVDFAVEPPPMLTPRLVTPAPVPATRRRPRRSRCSRRCRPSCVCRWGR